MGRAKFDYEIVRGINRKRSRLERLVHPHKTRKGKGLKRTKKKDPVKLTKIKKPQFKKYGKITKPFNYALHHHPTNRKRTKKKKILTKLRPSITPGTILILLSGADKGKRGIYLKQLSSGLLLLAGPKSINGMGLRRANQAYVIATSTKIDLTGVDLKDLEKLKDSHFKKPVEKRWQKRKKKEFFESEDEGDKDKKKKHRTGHRMYKMNGMVNKALAPLIKKVPHLAGYMRSKFRLQNNSLPHLMKF